MKRILYIHHAGGIGGAPLSLLYLLQQLDRDRYDPVVITLKDGPIIGRYRAEDIETHVAEGIQEFSHTTLEWYGGRDLWRLPGKLLSIGPSIRRTQSLVERFQPDLVHLNSSTLTPSAIGATRTSVPIVWHIREPLAQGYLGFRRRWIQQSIDRHASAVVAICQNDADQLIPSDRIHVIYNFVHFDQFDRNKSGKHIRNELGIAPNAPMVVFLGGASKPKGTLTLIRALPALIEQVPDVAVILAGHPPRPAKLQSPKDAIKGLLGVNAYNKKVQDTLASFPSQVRDAVYFTGIREDIPSVLAASQCLVFPSSVPHFARPVIEAAAMGIPSVASDLGGPRELIDDGKTGRLVPANNPAALAEALVTLLQNPESTQAMGEAAYKQALQRFDAQKNAEATIALYDDLLV